MSRIFKISFASVYPHYVTKVEKKGRTQAELDQVIEWLTGFDESALSVTSPRAPPSRTSSPMRPKPQRSSITGRVCGVRVRGHRGPPDAKIRYLDKLVDELAKGKAMEKILRA